MQISTVTLDYSDFTILILWPTQFTRNWATLRIILQNYYQGAEIRMTTGNRLACVEFHAPTRYPAGGMLTAHFDFIDKLLADWFRKMLTR